tara:strand:+ start:402 stop:647 length:246 start_codon:yes stop_codon:yes gene_type:complete
MKIEITETPKVTYDKVIYGFKAKIKDVEYEIFRHEDDNGAETFCDPEPNSDEIYEAIELLFEDDRFHYNTSQSGEIIDLED